MMKSMGIKPSIPSLLIVLFLKFANVGPDLMECSQIAPALYVFGDSLFDCGNNNFLPTMAKANFLPYGVNFVQGVTGRFTNGRTVADFMAEFLGLPYAPPYLSIHDPRILTGLNYASATCGLLPETGRFMGKCLSMKDQLDLFEKTVKSELSVQFKTPDDLSKYLSKSIFLFSVGSNDYLVNYLQPALLQDPSKRISPPQFTQLLMDALSHQFERLYNLGARKFVTFEIGPMGCVPAIAMKQNGNGNCVQETNQLASLFNEQLGVTLANLTSAFRGSFFVLGRATGIGSYDAVANPHKYGLEDGRNPCCQSGLRETYVCMPFTVPCSQPNSHFFFDGYHPTEAINSAVATGCFNGSNVCTPLNIEKLVQM